MNYTEVQQTLNNRNSKKIGNNTYLELNSDNSIGLKLHNTQVVIFYPKYAVLNSGGWYTSTTKERINKFSPAYVSQKNSIWYLDNGSLFYEGIKIDYTGKIISKVVQPKVTEVKNTKVKAKIKKYIDLTIKQMEEGKMPIPTSGDCWFCSLRTVDNMTLGEVSNSTEHLKAHFEENYIVPSLVWNAVAEAGYPYPAVITGFDSATGYNNPQMTSIWAVRNSMRKYLNKRLLKQEYKSGGLDK